MINYPLNLSRSGLTIYDHIDPRDYDLFIPTDELESILSNGLIGLSLEGFPIKSRSKYVKQHICQILGYPVPSTFAKTQPRFPGQNFDVYNQKGWNLQIWNEPVDVNRRYVLVHIDEDDIVSAVKVITGDVLALLDRTGKLTHKYQARMREYASSFCSPSDTDAVSNYIDAVNSFSPNYVMREGALRHVSPAQFPISNELLPIAEVYRRLYPIVGQSISYLDAVQERNRGAEIHELACHYLGYGYYEDDGTYPDIANQLLEVKLQTSPTIDLGLHSPEDGQEIVTTNGISFFSQDIRYAIFDGTVMGDEIQINNLYVVTGEEFSRYFPMFQGKGTNSKLQLPLPHDFFS